MNNLNSNEILKVLAEELNLMDCCGKYADIVNSLAWECSKDLIEFSKNSEAHIFNHTKPFLVLILRMLATVIEDEITNEDKSEGSSKLVWLNIETGEFSNSWGSDVYAKVTQDIIKGHEKQNKFKLIEYKSLTDSDFEFSHGMVIK